MCSRYYCRNCWINESYSSSVHIFFLQFLTTGMCRIYYYSNCWINNSYSNSVHIFFQIRLQCTIIYLLVEIFIRYLLFDIDSKFDYHGTIGDWFEVSLCFLVVIFFRNHGIETKVVSRHQFTPELIRWADVLFTAGGDGTYLLAASKVTDKNKPLIGINTDPSR